MTNKPTKNKEVEELLKIYSTPKLYRAKIDDLFEFALNLIAPSITIPSNTELLKMGRKLNKEKELVDSIKFNKEKQTFDLSWHANSGCNGDWGNSESLSPLVFYFKFIKLNSEGVNL